MEIYIYLYVFHLPYKTLGPIKAQAMSVLFTRVIVMPSTAWHRKSQSLREADKCTSLRMVDMYMNGSSKTSPKPLMVEHRANLGILM